MSTRQWIVGEDWPARPGPHRLGGNSHRDVFRAWLFAAWIVAVCGVVLFGLDALIIVLVAMVSALAAEVFVGLASRRPIIGGLRHTVLTGVLLAMTLPATVEWYVPMIGSLVAIVLGKGVFGGMGHYVWQPALVGRVVVQFLFGSQLSLGGALLHSPILSPGHLLIGDLDQARLKSTGTYRGWLAEEATAASDAWLMERPVQALRRFAEGGIKPDRGLAYEPLLRDHLPPWQDTVFGTVPGGIGETCTLGLIVAGFYLIYRGYLRWQLPVGMLAAAAVAAAVLPVELPPDVGGYDWLPVFQAEQGRAVGVAYVLYHLTAGQLVLGAFLLAGDIMATPLRARGQAVFGIAIGVLTIFMRLYGVLDGECYWAILIMNSVVGIIDRQMKRPVLGMAV